jgi:amidase
MARSVADAALMLSAMAGVDPKDPVTSESVGKAGDYRAALDKGGLKGARIGVARNFFGHLPELDAVIEKALLDLKAQGAVLVDTEVPNVGKYGDSETEVLLYEFKTDLEAYLKEYAPNAPVSNMADVIAFNQKHRQQEMPYFGQEYLEQAQAKGNLETPAYKEALANNRRYARAEGIDQVMKQHQLDALVAPTGGPAWLTDFINGDHFVGGFSSPAVGLSFVGAAYSEAALIRMAYAYEQATLHRRAPQFPPSVSLAVR